jgi:hypothetical protein
MKPRTAGCACSRVGTSAGSVLGRLGLSTGTPYPPPGPGRVLSPYLLIKPYSFHKYPDYVTYVESRTVKVGAVHDPRPSLGATVDAFGSLPTIIFYCFFALADQHPPINLVSSPSGLLSSSCGILLTLCAPFPKGYWLWRTGVS